MISSFVKVVADVQKFNLIRSMQKIMTFSNALFLLFRPTLWKTVILFKHVLCYINVIRFFKYFCHIIIIFEVLITLYSLFLEILLVS